ncbi:flagellar hook-basal body complex protein FliE [Pontibacillus litoralis]|uniref:Flagellar hook-basal body complex protein FliE n=1 Tax=Pontibacillus litoralis JSM 072002 TaxID=1385512 RepID=A0A0A5HXX0_9BACI|nr:flagellar hook-basal body complex protein FliE [Pontibacillus litoralis]KGX88452.1 hypothetical protein N784_07235 [Pontibacillus litoralis JSM 072002]
MNTIHNTLPPLQPLHAATTAKVKNTSPADAQSSFANSLKSAIEQVNKANVASDQKTEQLVKGEVNNLHDVMITAQKASIMMQTAIEVQSKAIDAYKEISRMQI